jgi:nucleoside-diphosphate kinase
MTKLPSHEQTLVLLKPDTIQRGIVGEVITRLERTGLKIVAIKMVWVDKDHAAKHYHDLQERLGELVFSRTLDMITEAPVIAIVLEGHHATEVVRKIVGSTFPRNAAPGTIRGDYAHLSWNTYNLIHASGNKKEAQLEIPVWFKSEEIHSYEKNDDRHVLAITEEDEGLRTVE